MTDSPLSEDDLVLALLASRSRELPARSFCRLLKDSGGAEEILRFPKKHLENEGLARLLKRQAEVSAVRASVRAWQAEGIELVPIHSPRYPESLRAIYDPPVVLFARGNLPSIPFSIAIVGSRRADLRGCEIAEEIARELASCGVCVVSGLALGIDSAAHRGALKTRLLPPTVAVLGNGLRQTYPPQNEDLQKAILDQGGALLSQFEPDERPWPSNFLNRNRLIAGMAKGVVVIQATARSGSLATARYALEEGRDVMAVPGDIRDPRYEGSNRLIKEGAVLITAGRDILSHQGIDGDHDLIEAGDEGEQVVLSGLQNEILSQIEQQGQIGLDELTSRVSCENLNAELTLLELGGWIARRPGNMLEVARLRRH